MFFSWLSRWWTGRLGPLCSLLFALIAEVHAQDRIVLYSASSPGVSKTATWGLDTAWYDENNLHRGGIFMGTNNVDVVRVSFTTTNALTSGQLGADQLYFLTNRLTWVDRWANRTTTVAMNEDSPTIDPWYYGNSFRTNINTTNWAANVAAHALRAKQWGRTIVSVAPYNEADYYTSYRPCTMQTYYDTLGFLITNSVIATNNIRLSDCTLNADLANTWFNFLKPRLAEGTTHELAGSFDNFASFFQNVVSSGDHATDDEMHNVMEAIVGVEYGLNTGIWWGTAERARGEFVKASHGVRLGYAEHRPNWTAAAVYRGTNGAVQAFVGESERQSNTGTYQFFSQDRDVFYDGQGPQRAYTLTTTGDGVYGSASHHVAERVVNITWGADVQPAINGRYYIVNRNSGKVLENPGNTTNNGVVLQQTTYTGALSQQWDVVPLPNSIGGDYSYYSIVNASSGITVDVTGGSYTSGATIQQWNGGTNVFEQWILQYNTNGYFKIRTKWCNKVMAVNGASTSSGATIVQWDDTGTLDHEWRFIPIGASPTDVVAPPMVVGINATANPRSVRLNWNASAASDLGGYTVLRSTNASGPFEIVARGLTSTTFTDKFANQNQTYYYMVKAVDKSWNSSINSAVTNATPSGGPTLVARYAFDGDTSDSSGNANYPIVTNGTPAYAAGKFGSAFTFDGSSQSLMLPANMLAGVTNFTFAAWVYWNGGNAWQRIFDFGNGTTQYMFLSPSSGSGTLRFAITTNSSGGEQIVETSPLATGVWQHVAVTRNGNMVKLYKNGVPVATNLTTTVAPADFNPALNYLGKSQWPDPLLNGRLDEVFVYNYALTDTEIARLTNNVPPPPTIPTTLTTALSANGLSFSWPLNYVGCRLESNAVSIAATDAWFTVANSAATNQVSIPMDSTATNMFFRLSYP